MKTTSHIRWPKIFLNSLDLLLCLVDVRGLVLYTRPVLNGASKWTPGCLRTGRTDKEENTKDQITYCRGRVRSLVPP